MRGKRLSTLLSAQAMAPSFDEVTELYLLQECSWVRHMLCSLGSWARVLEGP